MSEGEQNQIKRGTRDQFHWLLAYDYALSDILRACPDVVVGKHVAITAFDSGPIRGLSEKDRKAGWELRSEIAYSPQIATVEEFDSFYDDSYDEWYVFGSPADLGSRIDQQTRNIFQTPPANGEVVPFVNYHDLGLNSPEHPVASLFWQQMSWINPVVYLSDNQTWLTVVSADATLIESVSQKLAALK